MDNSISTHTSNTEAATGGVGPTDVELDDELLIEEISIDGMCGVY